MWYGDSVLGQEAPALTCLDGHSVLNGFASYHTLSKHNQIFGFCFSLWDFRHHNLSFASGIIKLLRVFINNLNVVVKTMPAASASSSMFRIITFANYKETSSLFSISLLCVSLFKDVQILCLFRIDEKYNLKNGLSSFLPKKKKNPLKASMEV